jgi:tRNA nucleotidyltransferase (CCA-adding enzyme)
MNSINKVLKGVINQIIPLASDRKKTEDISKALKKKLAYEYEKAKIKAKISLAGSIAKDTWLKKDPDIDIFVSLPTKIPRKNLDQIILKIAKKAIKNSKHIERFAEHPYLETYIDKIRVNIVPCYQVDLGKWKSATDRTPYHTKYINKFLNQELRNQVRLLKKFFKGINVYGAEIKIGGFSGYLCELLILHYKSFIKTLKVFSKYKKPIIIDQNNLYQNNSDPALLFSDPLIVIDPVDKNRNVASALKSKKLYEFIGAARAFLRKPTKDFFFPPQINSYSLSVLESKIAERESSLLFILTDNINAVPDVLWGQLYKTQRSIRKILKNNDFKILKDAVWTDEKNLTVFVIELENSNLPKIQKRIGPPLGFEEECNSFIFKHAKDSSLISGPYIQNKRWVILIKRTHFNANNLLIEKLSNDDQNTGIPKQISKSFRNSLQILVNFGIANHYKKNQDFAVFLSKFLLGKPFWLTYQTNK